ncbi:hypothetical protein ACETK8_01275 [Brevundimonas staleyi]|uniref:Uncharacterized protein n=1 Tax=Brevundimonas staleyi TaxID=74326 RepID=A0ABW0FSQ1_9CAUL
MRRLVLIVLAAVALPGAAAAQTYGQPYHGGHAPTTYGQPYGGQTYGYGQSYGQSYGYQSSGYGDPRAYRPPVQYGHDRGGRYGYSTGQWTRWSSPPGRGYHDVYGYNDDRAPRGTDHRRYRDDGCYCGVGAYLYDR